MQAKAICEMNDQGKVAISEADSFMIGWSKLTKLPTDADQAIQTKEKTDKELYIKKKALQEKIVEIFGQNLSRNSLLDQKQNLVQIKTNYARLVKQALILPFSSNILSDLPQAELISLGALR